MGDGHTLVGQVTVIGQNVKGAAGRGGQLNGVIKGQRIGLHRVAHDQQVRVIGRVAAIGDADLDRVDLTDIHRRFERQHIGHAVHFGVELISGVVAVQVRVGPAVDRVNRHVARHRDRHRHKGAVDPDAKGIVHAAVDIFRVFFRREHELHRDDVAGRDEVGGQNCPVQGAHPGHCVQLRVAVDTARVVGRGACQLVGIGGSVAVGNVGDFTGRQDHTAVRRNDVPQR